MYIFYTYKLIKKSSLYRLEYHLDVIFGQDFALFRVIMSNEHQKKSRQKCDKADTGQEKLQPEVGMTVNVAAGQQQVLSCLVRPQRVSIVDTQQVTTFWQDRSYPSNLLREQGRFLNGSIHFDEFGQRCRVHPHVERFV